MSWQAGQLEPVDVVTVGGMVSSHTLGLTLMHEHLFLDARGAVTGTAEAEVDALRDRAVRIEDLVLLREHPYSSLDNCLLDDAAIAESELADFVERGGKTVVDVSCWGIGRDPVGLLAVARATGLNVVMGTGLYLERSHGAWTAELDVAGIAERIINECRTGVSVPCAEGEMRVRPGILGEIGVSPDFTNAERASLRAAARAQLATGLPLMVHLPAWQRRGHEVLDVCEAEGVDPGAIVLAHMDPSVGDVDYQASLCARKPHLEFDGVGMGLSFPGEGCMPCDEEIARGVVQLFERGHGDQVLLSQDVFLKVQLRRYGGNGYAHVLRSFLPRLKRLGLSQTAAEVILTEHPRRVFEYAASTRQ